MFGFTVVLPATMSSSMTAPADVAAKFVPYVHVVPPEPASSERTLYWKEGVAYVALP